MSGAPMSATGVAGDGHRLNLDDEHEGGSLRRASSGESRFDARFTRASSLALKSRSGYARRTHPRRRPIRSSDSIPVHRRDTEERRGLGQRRREGGNVRTPSNHIIIKYPYGLQI